jgi:hypothetical protein
MAIHWKLHSRCSLRDIVTAKKRSGINLCHLTKVLRLGGRRKRKLSGGMCSIYPMIRSAFSYRSDPVPDRHIALSSKRTWPTRSCQSGLSSSGWSGSNRSLSAASAHICKRLCAGDLRDATNERNIRLIFPKAAIPRQFKSALFVIFPGSSMARLPYAKLSRLLWIHTSQV